MQTRLGIVMLVAVTLVTGIACGDNGGGGPTGPTAGTLTMNLATPNADDGAILIRVAGTGITQFAAANGTHYLYFRQDGQSVTAVLSGDIDSS